MNVSEAQTDRPSRINGICVGVIWFVASALLFVVTWSLICAFHIIALLTGKIVDHSQEDVGDPKPDAPSPFLESMGLVDRRTWPAFLTFAKGTKYPRRILPWHIMLGMLAVGFIICPAVAAIVAKWVSIISFTFFLFVFAAYWLWAMGRKADMPLANDAAYQCKGECGCIDS